MRWKVSDCFGRSLHFVILSCDPACHAEVGDHNLETDESESESNGDDSSSPSTWHVFNLTSLTISSCIMLHHFSVNLKICIMSDDARSIDNSDYMPCRSISALSEDRDDRDSQVSEADSMGTTLMLPGGGPGDWNSETESEVDPDMGQWWWAPLWNIDDEIYSEPALKRSRFV